MNSSDPVSRRKEIIVYAICFAVALVEGYDLQSAGVAAPKFISHFGMSPSELGWVFSSSTIGLLFGAPLGGIAADRIGRHLVLGISIFTFGLFSILTAVVQTTDAFLIARFLTGLGLGSAMPNLIAVVAETGSQLNRVARISTIAAGMPLGGACAGYLSWWGGDTLDWRIIFWVGGLVPIALAIAILAYFPRATSYHKQSSSMSLGRDLAFTLAGEGRAVSTSLLWVAFFFTLAVLYLIFNWLPSLLVGRGFSPKDASLGTLVYALGGGVGSALLGRLVSVFGWRLMMFGAYFGLGAAIYHMAVSVSEVSSMLAAAFALGLFGTGAQMVLYAISPGIYPREVRGAGLGCSIAAGRMGSIAGPVIAGQLLAGGSGPTSAMLAMLPFVFIAMIAVLGLKAAASYSFDERENTD